jgi:uncharacterized protein (TIGR04255 family)
LYSKIDGNKEVIRLDAANIPYVIRKADINLKFSSLVKISYDKFFVSIGNHSVIVGCQLPYIGWKAFKEHILQILNYIKEADVIKQVIRASLKYVNLLENNKNCILKEELLLSGKKLNNYQLRTEFHEGNFIHIMTILSSATVLFDNKSAEEHNKKEGFIIDTDSIMESKETTNFTDWLDKFKSNLDKLHDENHEIFFNCLNNNILQDLGPIYE